MSSWRRRLDLRRFSTLADSYGGHLWRWPLQARQGGALLLDHSAAARMILADAEQLDRRLLAAASADAGSPGGQDAALSRLRARVASRIATMPPARRAPAWRTGLAKLALRRPEPGWPPRLGWLGALGGGSIVVALGLLVGIADLPPAPTTSLLAVLDAAQLAGLGP